MSACAIRAHLAEFGIIAPQGRHRVDQLAAYLEGEEGKHVPLLARETLRLLIDQLGDLSGRIATLEAELAKLHRIHPIAQLLSTIPGVGPITSTALVATVLDPSVFRSGREFAAWIGLTPRQHSSGGKERLGRITKRGDVYLRHLLVIGARKAPHLLRSGDRSGDRAPRSCPGRHGPSLFAPPRRQGRSGPVSYT